MKQEYGKCLRNRATASRGACKRQGQRAGG
jgi:hypothetical protein